MCCFSRPVRFVGGTKIFARRGPGRRQMLAYAMDVELDGELAMVLPLPVPRRSPDDAVAFLNLEGYERFFGDLADAFPPVFAPAFQQQRVVSVSRTKPKLVVHEVGLFEASFVPTREDFVRLDERFRMPESLWEDLPDYEDWGFAVFQLKPKKGFFGVKRQSVHPMAFSFPTREPEALYFPLLHVHDGRLESRAKFDHMLYCQADGMLEATLGWTRSNGPLDANVDVARARGLVDGQRGGFCQALVGSLPNMDLWLRAPEGVGLADLQGGGECYAYEVNAFRAHDFGPEDERFRRWKVTASTRLAALCRGMRDGLRDLEAGRRSSWRLAPLTDALPAHFMNGNQLWSGTSFMDGARARGEGRGRVRFSPFSERVPVQSVTLGFESLPDDARAQEISVALAHLVDAAAYGDGS